MNPQTKIHLSKLEIELAQNKEWILTKRSIINKVCKLFGEMHKIYKQIAGQETSLIIDRYKNSGGKISKGENYKELPYVIMDYPALFTKENIFAIRTMFWWGNFFSISLHLSGKKFQLQKDLSKLFLFLQENNFYICVCEDEWQHNFEPSNYVKVSDFDQNKFREISNRNFFKIAKRLEINKWDTAPEFLEKSFTEIIEFLKISFPAGEKDL
ncbi:hypothetical protein FW778_09995 [Ginsengibacter hankyongi]|uniref:Uncharacterized protein n=1 Tax=Ginsengibacter hankyongi TaxID=2607284 RepID=A0A5J5IGW6_9BACT|nr:hypothetical protein [Ginsengibacter hankyongi]KAA9039156.1 hypothetical protein FW778_09995 [Ginsengibacter hankyongi]